MPAVAEVQFKAVNAQQVEGAFKSIGTSAQASTTKIQQNSNAMKSLGQGMKSSVGGIAQVGTAFATLSLSVVGTWRAYRDLGDAQLKVDRANTKLTKSQEKLNDLKKKAAALQKQGAKGGLEDQRRSIEIAKAEQALGKAIHDHGKNSLEAADARLKLNEAQAKGTDSGGKLAEIQKDIAIQEEVVANNTFAASEAQESYNDTQQDFYLSILPTALSGLSTLALSLNGIKNMFSGGGGLLGGFGAFGLVIAGISAAILAFKTNFLGFRDLVMGVIDFVKSQFGDWQKTVQEVFDLIQKGDWGGAFARIAKAAQDFWNYLVTHVPFFGGLNKIIVALKNGDWAGIFAIIQQAAVKFWEDLKKQIPFFAGAQQFFEQLFAGDFSGAWQTLTDGLTQAWAAIVKAVPLLGDIATYLKTKFELARDTAKASFNAMAVELTKKGGAFDNIQQGLAKIGSGDVGGGVNQMVTGIQQGLEQVKNAINNWVKVNFGVDLSVVESQAKDLGLKIMGWIGNSLTFVSTTWIDPFVASLFKAETWTTALTAVWDSILKVGNSIVTFLMGAITNVASNPEGTATWFSQIGTAIWDGIVTWMSANMPQTTKVLQSFAQSLIDAVAATGQFFTNVGNAIWNGLIEGIKAAVAPIDLTGAIRGALDKLKVGIEDSPPAKLPISMNDQELENLLHKTIQDIKNKKTPLTVTANTNQAQKQIQNLRNQAARPIIIPVRFNVQGGGNISGAAHGTIPKSGGPPRGPQAHFTGGQHGYLGTVKRPTMFLAGEGHRQEDISINPRGSRGGGGGGRDIYVGPIYLGSEKIIDIIRYKMTENSAIFR